jgi:hypothetical protein
MSDNVTIAIIAAAAVVISGFLALGGAIFAYVASNRTQDKRLEAMDKRFDRIDGTLTLIQGDLKQFSDQIFKIRAKIGMD